MPVGFFYHRTTFRISKPRKTAAWVKTIAESENRQIGEITYVFCKDDYLLELNRTYLRHHTLTDIITFPYHQRQQPLQGEIYISIDRVRHNAKIFEAPFQTELLRVMAHGVLHLCGYQDKTPSQKRQMRKKEEACLSLWD
jgi:rRNA maturation RNase YbeY